MGGRGGSSGLSAQKSQSGEPFAYIKQGGKTTAFVTRDGDEYKFSKAVPTDGKRIDTASAEYKAALRDYNIKAQFHENGKVTVLKGGLFNRKKEFSSVDSFVSESNRRIDSLVERSRAEQRRYKQGRLTQLEAENIKSTVQKKTVSDAANWAKKMIVNNMRSARIRAEAGEDMKRRLAEMVRKKRRK